MERVLGTKIGRDRSKLQGTGDGEDPGKVRFVSFPSGRRIGDAFEEITSSKTSREPSHGGCSLKEDEVLAPDGTCFRTIVFHGDVEGWQQQIENGARSIGAISARLVGHNLLTSNGLMFPVDGLQIQKAKGS